MSIFALLSADHDSSMKAFQKPLGAVGQGQTQRHFYFMPKDSFILYVDSLSIMDKLNDEQCGQLFRAIRHYHLTKEEPTEFWLTVAFESFKRYFEANEIKYAERCEVNKHNGKRGGRPKKVENEQDEVKPNETEEKQKNPIGFSETERNRTEPKKPDTDTDTVSDNDTDITSSIEEVPFLEFEVVGEEKPNPLETLGSDTAFLKKKKAAVKEKKWPLAEMEKEWDKLLQKKFEVSYYPNGKERAALAQIAQKLLFQVTEKERRTGNIAMQTEHEKILGAWGYLLGRHEHWGKWHSTVKELSIINSHLTTILTNSKNGNQQTSSHGKSVAAEAIAILQRDSQQRG